MPQASEKVTTFATEAEETLKKDHAVALSQGKAELKTISISKKDEKGVEHKLDFTYPVAKTPSGCAALAGSEADFVRIFNQAWGTICSSGVRQKLSNELAGPEKRIVSAAKVLVKTGAFGDANDDASLAKAVAAVRQIMSPAPATA